MFKFLFTTPTVDIGYNHKVFREFFNEKGVGEQILKEMFLVFSKIPESDYFPKIINIEISSYIFKKYETEPFDRAYSTKLYDVIKIVIKGSDKVKMIAHVCYILGKKEVLRRIKSFKII